MDRENPLYWISHFIIIAVVICIASLFIRKTSRNTGKKISDVVEDALLLVMPILLIVAALVLYLLEKNII